MEIKILKKQLFAELKQDKKKAAILSTLFIVALFMGIKMLAKGSAPAQAQAADGDTFLVGDDVQDSTSSQSYAQLSLDNYGNDPSGQADKEDVVFEKDDSEITRDIFWVNPKYFVVLTEKKGGEVIDEATRQQAKLKALQEKIQKEAQALMLEGAILGDKPAAIINGQLAEVSSKIKGFEIVRISEKSCDVKKEGVTIRIKMK